ncbi:hypothetical protein KORDIASMS9_01436 [Kordia sp. SMS9]|uniref:DUF1737 domain-containing protein n=1 Tax=Kordia sp. SMS9 TaxID=2282170 RepID=UPI000E0DF889|nr:DUF1737 domain-containing protein [Kordia sp. SMS9]AXG69216.1 hypothetical protein KORDIASMS9_01436 [Kordia sp. SMS9]
MKYEILRDTKAEELESRIEKALSRGWKLQGGVSISTRGDNDIFFAQAIICE